MRWNCPHCEELVTAEIDFGSTKRAYVRCGKCNGLATVHRSAALAPVMTTKVPEKVITPPTPPPFRGPNAEGTVTPRPAFSYPKPPAFLLKSTYETPAPEPTVSAPRTMGKAMLANIAVGTAAVIAITSGVYLYIQGKKVFPKENTAQTVAPDKIISKASSTSARNVGVVRVPRAIVRGAPSMEAPAIATLDQTSLVLLLEEKDGWTRFESAKLNLGNSTGWLRSDLITRIPN